MVSWKKALFINLGLCAFMTSVQADYDYKFDSREVPRGQYESAIAQKLTRGIVNAAYGWTELVRTPVDWAEGPEHGFISTAVVAVPYGIVRAVGRTVTGAYEVATAYA